MATRKTPRLKQEDYHKFWASLGYTAIFRPDWVRVRHTLKKTNQSQIKQASGNI